MTTTAHKYYSALFQAFVWLSFASLRLTRSILESEDIDELLSTFRNYSLLQGNLVLTTELIT